MEIGLKNAQVQVEKLTIHNQMLLRQNEELFQAGFPNNNTGTNERTAAFGIAAVPVDDYSTPEEHDNYERH